MKTNQSIVKSLLVATTAALLSASSALAQTWTDGGDGQSWGDANNWTPATVPNGAGAAASLTGDVNSAQSVSLDGNTYTLGSLTIGSTGSSAYNVGTNNAGGDGSLTFDNNGHGAEIEAVGNGGDTINGISFTLADNLVVNDDQTGTTGTPYGFELGYNTTTSFTGTGNLTINNNNPNGDSFSSDFPSVGVYGSIDNVGTVTLGGTGTGGINIKDTVGGNVTQFIQNSATSSSHVQSGFASSNTSIIIEAGILGFNDGSGYDLAPQVIIGDTAAHGSNSVLQVGDWTTGSGQTVSGFGSVTAFSSAVATVSGTTIAPGSVGHIGTLSFTNHGLSLASGTNLTFLLGSSGHSSMLEADGLNLSLGLNLNLANNANADGLGSLDAGTYELMSYGGISGVSATDITSMFNITGPGGYTYDVTDTNFSGGAGQIDLTVVAAAPEPGTWAMLLGGLGMAFSLRKLRGRRA